MSSNVTVNIELEIVLKNNPSLFPEHHKGPVTLNANLRHKFNAFVLCTFSLMGPIIYNAESLSHC